MVTRVLFDGLGLLDDLRVLPCLGRAQRVVIDGGWLLVVQQ